MTSLGFLLRLGDHDGSRLADDDRIQGSVIVDDRSADDRVHIRVIAHHDCWHTRVNDNVC